MDTQTVAQRFHLVAPFLDERTRRLFAAAEAQVLGHGGVTAVARATGVSRRAIGIGLKELAAPQDSDNKRIRRPGAGRKRVVDKDSKLRSDLEGLVEPLARGDPESPLRWTCKSVRRLAEELQHQGHSVSHETVSSLLTEMGYSLQANRKTMEGESQHPDRNAQFEYINARVKAFQAAAQPAISVDTKKKELVGDFKNAGQEWRPQHDPERVRVHDFEIPEQGKVAPYGIYDMAHNLGWVNVGTDHDTAAFAVASIRDWWQTMGQATYPEAHELLITADGGGSNGYRLRLWKTQLQAFADQSELTITVCHLPPGTSKWNKIEHRLFSFITRNWRGMPLVSHEVIVNLIAATTSRNGLRVQAKLDTHAYPSGLRVTAEQMAQVRIHKHDFHGEWNYTISPTSSGNDTLIV
jgi:transposase